MDTPFGLRRYLLLSFPEIVAATVSPSRQKLLIRYVPNSAGLPVHDTVVEWGRTNRTVGIGVHVERVTAIDPADLPNHQLGGLNLPVDVAEDAAINVNGIITHARRRWPDDFVRVEEGLGRVVVIVASKSSEETRSAIAREVSGLLHDVRVDIEVDRKNEPRVHAKSRTELRLHEDWDLMHARCDDAVSGRHIPKEREPGVYAYRPFKPASLYCHLAVAERVYVEMPRTTAEVARRYQVEWRDFVDALSTKRILPVFREPARNYEAGMIDVVVDTTPDVILPGEARLNELATFVSALPLLELACTLDERWREAHAYVRQDPGFAPVLPVFDAIAETAARARLVARRGDEIAKVWAPLVFTLERLFRSSAAERRELELLSAVEVTTAANAVGARPVLAAGDLIGDYVRWMHGIPSPTVSAEPPIVEEAPVVAELILARTDGISLRQFATSFDGAAIRAMWKLTQSPRLVGRPVADVVEEWAREVHEFNGRQKRTGSVVGAAVGIGMTLIDLSVGWGLFSTVSGFLTKRLIEKSILPDEMRARLLGQTNEAAYMARIINAIQNK